MRPPRGNRSWAAGDRVDLDLQLAHFKSTSLWRGAASTQRPINLHGAHKKKTPAPNIVSPKTPAPNTQMKLASQ